MQQDDDSLLLRPVQLLQALCKLLLSLSFKVAAGGLPAVIIPLHDRKLTACRVVAGQ